MACGISKLNRKPLAPWAPSLPQVFLPFVWAVPRIVALMGWLAPGVGSPAYLPSSLLRYITFKLSMDLDQIPGLGELTK